MEKLTQAETAARDAALKDADEKLTYGRRYGQLIWQAAKDYYKPPWVPIKSEADLPKEPGRYWVTWAPSPMNKLPHVTDFPLDDVYRTKFWMGSFLAWMRKEPPQVYTEEPHAD